MLKQIAAASATTMTALIVGILPMQAQTLPQPNSHQALITNNIELNRAKNLARQVAEKANGGLSNYRAENSMYGPATEAPYKDNGDGTYTFTFTGHKPGSSVKTVKTVVTVAKDASRIALNDNSQINAAMQ